MLTKTFSIIELCWIDLETMRRVWEMGLSIAVVFLLLTTPVAGAVEFGHTPTPSVQNSATLSQTTAAQITATEADGGTYFPGETVAVDLTVENTGDAGEEFYVDASIQRPNGNWVTGDGTTVYLNPGESRSLTLDVGIPDDATEGTYSAGSGVFQSSAKDEQYDYGQDLDSFRVESPSTDAGIVDTTADGGTYQPGDEVPIDVTIENTGDTTHDFYVDASVQRPNGNWVTGEGTTVSLSPGETDTVTLDGHIPDDAQDGTWSAGSGVFHSSDKDDRYAYGQDLDSFTVEEPTTSARITRTVAEGGTYRPGDTVPVEVTVENTGDTTHDFYVDASVRRPNGNWVTGESTTLDLSPGERATVFLDAEIPADAEDGTWSAGSGVFHSGAKDNQYAYGQDLDSFSVEQPATNARITRTAAEGGTYSPGAQVPVEVTVENTGDTMHDFYVDASIQRPNGNWVTGEDSTVGLSPGESRTVWLDVTIPADASSGTFSAGAGVFHSSAKDDRYGSGQDLDAFTVEEPTTSARITRTVAESGTYSPGAQVPVEVTIENTGDRTHDFYVDASIQRPNGDWITGEDATVYLSPGETDTVSLAATVPADARDGTWSAGAGVFHGSDKDDRYAYGQDLDSFTVAEPTTDARITRTVAEGGTYSPGEAVPVEVTVENTGDTTHDFYVDASIQRPNGDWVTGEDTSVYLSSGETERVILDVAIPDAARSGTFSAGAGVFHSGDKDDRYDSGQDLDSFEVTKANTKPSAERVSPSDDLSAPVDESVAFRVGAEDVDGNLAGVEWYVDGEHVETTRSIEGLDDTATWAHEFESAGPHTVAAQVFDTAGGYSSTIAWEVAAEGATGSIRGRVTDADGNPISGATVYRGNGNRTRTDADGYFSYDRVRPGETELEVVMSGYESTSPKSVTVTDGQTSRVDFRLTEALGVSVSDVDIAARQYEAGDTATVTATVENTGPAEQTFVVTHSATGPTDTTYDERSEQATVTLGPGAERSVVLDWPVPATAPPGKYDATVAVWSVDDSGDRESKITDQSERSAFEVVPTSGTLTVNVYDSDGQPVGDATVALGDGKQALTDSAGTAQFSDVPEGTHEVSISREGYATATESVTVAAGQRSAHDVRLARPSGSIVSVDNVPREYQPGDDITPEIVVRNTGDVEASFDLTMAEPSGIDIQGSQRKPLTLAPGAQTTVEFTAELYGTETDRSVQFDLTAAAGELVDSHRQRVAYTDTVLSVRVVDADGNPVEGASVSPLSQTETVRTDSDGRARFTSLVPGQQVVKVKNPAVSGSGQSKTIDVATGERTTTVVRLEQTGTISGTVVTESGSPVSDGLVTINGEPAFIDSDGTFSFDDPFVVGKSYTVDITQNGESIHRQEITVAAGANDPTITVNTEDTTGNEWQIIDNTNKGALLGEVGVQTGVSGSKTLEYHAGWLGLSVIPVVDAPADIRDCLLAPNDGLATNGLDCGGAAVSTAGSAGTIIGVVTSGSGAGVALAGGSVSLDTAEDVGDAVKVTSSLVRNAPGKVDEWAEILISKIGSDNVSKVVDKISDSGVKTTLRKSIDKVRLQRAGFSSQQIKRVTDSGASLSEARRLSNNGADPQAVVRVAEDSSTNIENLKSAYRYHGTTYKLQTNRWGHIVDRHVTGSADKVAGETDYFPTGETIPAKNGRPAHTVPERMSKSDVRELVQEAIKKKGTSFPADEGDLAKIVYRPNKHGIEKMQVVVDENGRVITAYPLEGPAVDTYAKQSGEWN